MSHVYVNPATGTAAVSNTSAPGADCKLLSVMIHLSAACATHENLVIALDSGAGAAYDAVLDIKDMYGLTDYVWTPPAPILLKPSDGVLVTFTNTDLRTYGLETRWER